MLREDAEKRARKKNKTNLSFVKMFQNDRNGCQVVMCQTSDVLSFPTAALDIVGVDRLSGQLLCCT